MAKVWSKRFDNSLNPFIEKFNASIGFDRKLILEDLDCSIAHAKMLGKTKVLLCKQSYTSQEILNKLFKKLDDFTGQNRHLEDDATMVIFQLK